MLRQRKSPIAVFLDGLDWTGRSRRAPLFWSLFVWFVSFGVFLWARSDTNRLVEIGALVLASAAFFPLCGHTMRRLQDLALSPWLWWLVFVPGLNVLMMLILLTRRGGFKRADLSFALWLSSYLAGIVVTLLILSRIFWAPFVFYDGSMKPGILVGDTVAAAHFNGPPERGMIVVIREAGPSGRGLARRVVGLPGDSVFLADGIVHVNGQAFPQQEIGFFNEIMEQQGPWKKMPLCLNAVVGRGAECQKRRLRETQPEGKAYDILDAGRDHFDTVGPFDVPPGHVFVLGDNRDDALDSRVAAGAGGVGMVPVDRITHRVRRVIVSSSGRAWWTVWDWRSDRIFRAIE